MSTSINKMVKSISGLQGTKDLSMWEESFVENVVEKTKDGTETSRLTEKQLEIVLRIYNKHFA